MANPKNLRQRIRKRKICCIPWKIYKKEIAFLPISAQCLFSKDGLPWDILEIELKDENWLAADENLWDVLRDDRNLKRQLYCGTNNSLFDPYDEECDCFL